MSATDWHECPFCQKEIIKLKESYGKIPMDKFIELKEELIGDGDYGEENSYTPVREDTEYFLDNKDGKLHINMGFACQNCGREWSIQKNIEAQKGPKDKEEDDEKADFG
jgi:hypothetical protein